VRRVLSPFDEAKADPLRAFKGKLIWSRLSGGAHLVMTCETWLQRNLMLLDHLLSIRVDLIDATPENLRT